MCRVRAGTASPHCWEAGRAFIAYEACFPFPFNNSLAKFLPPVKFWSVEARREWRPGNVCLEGGMTVKILSWADGLLQCGARGDVFCVGL